jgi:uncharacterized protein YjbJ (UPF0337 family)
MGTFKKKAAEQELKGIGQRIKGKAQEITGAVTGDKDLRARGDLNQAGGEVRRRVGEAGRKISDAIERDRVRDRSRRSSGSR